MRGGGHEGEGDAIGSPKGRGQSGDVGAAGLNRDGTVDNEVGDRCSAFASSPRVIANVDRNAVLGVSGVSLGRDRIWTVSGSGVVAPPVARVEVRSTSRRRVARAYIGVGVSIKGSRGVVAEEKRRGVGGQRSPRNGRRKPSRFRGKC